MIALGPKRVVMTGLNPSAAAAALARDVQHGELFAFDRPRSNQVPLRGWIRGETFSLVRRTQFRNSFTPIVEGRIVAWSEGGSQLQLSLGMHFVPFLTIIGWIIVVASLVVLAAEMGVLSEAGLALAGIGLAGPGVALLLYRGEIDAVVQDITVAVTRPPDGPRPDVGA